MNVTGRRNAAVTASMLLLCSLGFGSWTQLTSGTTAVLTSVHFVGGTQVGYAVGADPAGGGVIVKTTDSGETWAFQSSWTILNSIHFKDNNNGYAVGAAGTAFRTTDGGATWIPMPVPSTDDLTGVQFPEHGQVGYIFLHPGSPPSKVLKTTDGGSTWTAISVGGPADVTRGGGFANDTIGVIVGDDGLVLGTTDGLGSTHNQDAQTNADLVAVAFSPADSGKGYLIGNDSTHGLIRYTDDGGATPWDSVRCNVAATAFYGIDMPTATGAYVCGANTVILRAVDDRLFYRVTAPPNIGTLYGLHFPNGVDTGYSVGDRGVILKTTDGGIPFWHAVAEGKEPVDRSVIRIASNPSRHGIALQSDADVRVSVFDAAGRVVMSRAATKGLNFLPLSKAGVYLVKVTTESFSTTQELVVQH